MPSKFLCSSCKKSFFKDFLVDTEAALIVCIVCNNLEVCLQEINEIKVNHASDIEALRLEIAQLKEELKKHSTYVSNVVTYSSVLKSHNNSMSAPNNSAFERVKNGAKPSSNVQSNPIPTQNSFGLLEEDSDDADSAVAEDCVLVGDSMLRNQNKYFCNRKHGRKSYSYSGHSLTGPKLLMNRVNEFTADSSSATTFFLHVGTNDLLNNKQGQNPSNLMSKYRSALRSIRDKSNSNKIVIVGVLPVLGESLDDTSDRKFINELLEELAFQENVSFVSFWKEFAQCHEYSKLFNKDGIHLSKDGDAKLGLLLDNFVRNFPHHTLQPCPN